MTEWFKVPVLKTGVFKIPWVRIPFHPHFLYYLLSIKTRAQAHSKYDKKK